MLARLQAAFRDWGVFATLLYALDRMLCRISSGKARIYLYKLELQPVPDKPLLPAHRGRQFEIQELTESHPALAMIPRPSEVIRKRFEQGSRCLGAFHNNELVGQLWIQLNSYQEDEVRCRFKLIPASKVAWDYDVYVDPQLRASFLFARLWDSAFELLRKQGIEWSASRVSAWNTASLSSHARLGARPASHALFIAIGRLQIMFATTLPFFHLSFASKQMPHLRVAAP